jgi:hypothetical protein
MAQVAPAPVKKADSGLESPKAKYNASFSVDGRNESDFYTGIKPFGPQRQSMERNLDLLKPAYENGEPLFSIELDDTKSRVARLTTLCYLFTCQGFGSCQCCEPACVEFCQFSIELQKKKIKHFLCHTRTEVPELPAQIKPVISADQSTQYGSVKIYPQHLVIKRVVGLQNDIVVIPLLSIQKMKIEEVDPGMNYGFTACCAKVRCCPLAKGVMRLKLYGRFEKTIAGCCGMSMAFQERRLGIAVIMTNRAEELMEEIQKAIEATGEKPHGDAFVQMTLSDPFGQAFARGSVTIVGKEGEAALPVDAIRVTTTSYIENMQGYQLKNFLASRGYKHGFEGLNMEQLRDEALTLFNSQFGMRYSENPAAFESDPNDCACMPRCLRSKGAKKTSPMICGCNVPQLPALAKVKGVNNEPEPDESPAQTAARIIKEQAMAYIEEMVRSAIRPTPFVGQALVAYETYEEIISYIPPVPEYLDMCDKKANVCPKCCKFQYVDANGARNAYVFKAQVDLD